MNQRTIWNERQNKPTFVVRDLSAYAPADVVYGSLLRRGVFKWFAVRRELIRLKDVWKIRIAHAHKALPFFYRGSAQRSYWRGYLDALEMARADVRALCHSSRWRAPDNDRLAQDYLRRREEA